MSMKFYPSYKNLQDFYAVCVRCYSQLSCSEFNTFHEHLLTLLIYMSHEHLISIERNTGRSTQDLSDYCMPGSSINDSSSCSGELGNTYKMNLSYYSIMKPKLIDVLKLKETNYKIKESAIPIYIWPNGVKGCKTYVMTCDLRGKPLVDEILFLVRGKAENKCLVFLLPEVIAEDEELLYYYLAIVQGAGRGDLPDTPRGGVDYDPGGLPAGM